MDIEERAGVKPTDTYTQVQAKVAELRFKDKEVATQQAKEQKEIDDQKYTKSRPKMEFPKPSPMNKLTLFSSVVDAYYKRALIPRLLAPTITAMAKALELNYKEYQALLKTAERVVRLWYSLQKDDSVKITLVPAEYEYTYVDVNGKPWKHNSTGVRVLKDTKEIKSGKHFIVDRTSYFIWAKNQLEKEIQND